MTKHAAQKIGITILFSMIMLGAINMFSEAIPKIAEDGHILLSLFFSAVASALIVGGLAIYAKIMNCGGH